MMQVRTLKTQEKRKSRGREWLKWPLAVTAGLVMLTGCALHPERMDRQAVWDQARSDIDELSMNQERVDAPITLYEAMGRAIKYNREYRVKLMQSALAMRQKDLGTFDLLPKLTANAGYAGSNHVQASSSESYRTGKESLEPSFSREKETTSGDATFTWSVLDFGLSYVRARQQSDRYLMAREVERKTVQNIVSDVRSAWWQALSAQRLLGQIDPLLAKVHQALETSRTIENRLVDAPLKALTYQRSLIDMTRTLESLRQELSQAKPRLASLMGLPFSQAFTLADPGRDAAGAAHLKWNVQLMEKIALLSRPELMESRYQTRITSENARVALLRLLPNINLDAGWNWDSNSYLVHNSWFDYGSRVSWNLVNIFKAPSTLRAIDAQKGVTREQRLAMSMAVLMQVHLAKANYLQSERQLGIEARALSVEDRILQQVTSASLMEAEGEQALIRQQLNQLLAQVRHDKAYAELQNHFGRLLTSMGVDPLPGTLASVSVQDLARALENAMTAWQAPSLDRVPGVNGLLPQALVPQAAEAPQVQVAFVTETVPAGGETAVSAPAVAPLPETVENKIQEDETAPEAVPVAPAPAPEATEAVSQPPVAEAPDQGETMGVITAQNLNLRRGPGVDTDILGQGSFDGQSFPILERKAGWVRVNPAGIPCWVSDQYVKLVQE